MARQTIQRKSASEISERVPGELDRLAADLQAFQGRVSDFLDPSQPELIKLLQGIDEMSQRAAALAEVSRRLLDEPEREADIAAIVGAIPLGDLAARLTGRRVTASADSETEIW